MNNQRRKQLREQYKQRTQTGGIYRIRCTASDRFYMNWEDDLNGAEKRHAFAVSTRLCNLPCLRGDWEEFGPEAFVFERLEDLEKTPEQTREEFLADLTTLLELWEEKTDMSDGSCTARVGMRIRPTEIKDIYD